VEKWNGFNAKKEKKKKRKGGIQGGKREKARRQSPEPYMNFHKPPAKRRGGRNVAPSRKPGTGKICEKLKGDAPRRRGSR